MTVLNTADRFLKHYIFIRSSFPIWDRVEILFEIIMLQKG